MWSKARHVNSCQPLGKSRNRDPAGKMQPNRCKRKIPIPAQNMAKGGWVLGRATCRGRPTQRPDGTACTPAWALALKSVRFRLGLGFTSGPGLGLAGGVLVELGQEVPAQHTQQHQRRAVNVVLAGIPSAPPASAACASAATRTCPARAGRPSPCPSRGLPLCLRPLPSLEVAELLEAVPLPQRRRALRVVAAKRLGWRRAGLVGAR